MRGKVVIGDLKRSSASEIWNSKIAKEIRKSVVDGSFSRCTERCPLLSSASIPLRSDIHEQDWGIPYREAIEHPLDDLATPPGFIKLVNDASCNLSCPSCRDDLYIAKKKKSDQILQFNLKHVFPMLETAWNLDILGNGEALASRATMGLLERIDPVKHKNLTIDLLTNGIAFNEGAWRRLSNLHGLKIKLNVSCDGISKDVYEKLRRGGKWEILQKNLEFIGRLRSEEMIKMLTLNFTVQRDNLNEIPFVGEFARKYIADRVILFRVSPWPHMDQKYYRSIDVFDPNHPDHQRLIEIARQIDDEIIEIGPLSVFRTEPGVIS